MTRTNNTTDGPKKSHDPADLTPARRAAAVLQSPLNPNAGHGAVYIEMGGGLVFALNADSTFSMCSQEHGGRPLLELTAKETRALFSFWWSIVAPGVLEHLPAAVAYVKAQRATEDDHGNA